MNAGCERGLRLRYGDRSNGWHGVRQIDGGALVGGTAWVCALGRGPAGARGDFDGGGGEGGAARAVWRRSVLAGGEVDRAALGRVVFVEAAAREWLEALVHPLVYAGWREALRAAPKGKHVIEVPLLFEQGLENWFDFTVCVATSCDRQLSLLERRGVPPAAAIPRISQQMPLAQKTEKADFVLLNDGLPEFLQAQIDRLIARLS